MNIIAVGETYTGPASSVECARISTNDAIFDLICYIKPQPGDIDACTKEKLKFGVAVLDAIPFIVVDFSWGGLDAYYSIFRVDPEKRVEWIETNGNAVLMIFVECSTNKVLGLRQIGLRMEITAKFKRAASEQLNIYDSARAVDIAAEKIMRKYDGSALMKAADIQIFR